MRRAARADANQSEIVAALRAAGAMVQHLHTIGHGCPDLLVGYAGRLWLMEVKDGDAPLTDDEASWHRNWRRAAGDRLLVVRTAEQALRAIGAIV